VSATDTGARTLVMSLAILVEGGLAVLALFIGGLFSQPPLETFTFDITAALIGVAATIPLLVLFYVLMRWPIGPMAPIRRFSLEVLCPVLSPCTVPDLGAISLLAGVGEEMLFRGTLQAALARESNLWLGLLAASVLFGVLHAITPAYAVMASVMGAYLGVLWLATGNILTPMIVHALYDFLVLWYLMAGPGRPLWDKPGDVAAESVEPATSDVGSEDS
jgi:membrane protease YdiL (CAAX protease family)